MKKLLHILALVFLFAPVISTAQNWSAQEREILKTMKKGWILWGEAIEKKDLNHWVDGLEPVEDFRGWWTTEGGLWGLGELDDFEKIFLKTVKGFAYEGMTPMSIRIYGDTGLVYYYVVYHVQNHTGQWTRFEDKRFEVFIKRDGKWRWAGCMATDNDVGGLK